MRLSHLLLREIAHRKLTFAAALLSVAVSVAVAVAAVRLLEAFDRETEQNLLAFDRETDAMLQAKQDEKKSAWMRYEDFVRRLNLELGFNLMILHKDENLSRPDEQARFLPEKYAEILSKSDLATINHVLPFLQQKVWWPERKRWITLYGTPGEVHIKNPKKQTPMVEAIRDGHASLGRGIHESLKLKEGDRFTFMGRKFIVQDCRGAEGFEEDEQIRIPLAAAQELLDKKGLITGLRAINCQCAEGPEGLALIRKQIQTLLPDTQVREHQGNMVVRAEGRAQAARQAEADLQREQASRGRLRAAWEENRDKLRAGREAFNAVLVPLLMLVAAIWLGLMMWTNVRRRRAEIAILRAIGMTSRRIITLVFAKAILIGLLGGAVGLAAGLGVAAARTTGQAPAPLNPALIPASLLGATLLAVLASWAPAMLASGTDPAVVLQQE